MENRKKINKRIRDILLGLIIPVFILLLWQYLGSVGIIRQTILPRPTILFQKLIPIMENGTLFENLLTSLGRVLVGYLLGAVLGLTFGLIIGASKLAGKLSSIMIGVLRPIPALACIPILILLFGIGELSKIVVIMIGSFWPVLLNTIQGIQTVDSKLLELGLVLEKKKSVVVKKIILPAAFPSIFTGLRLGISSSWTNIVAAEMIAASKGMGHMITYAREMSQPSIVLIGVLTIGLVGLLIDFVVIQVQKKALYWI